MQLGFAATSLPTPPVTRWCIFASSATMVGACLYWTRCRVTKQRSHQWSGARSTTSGSLALRMAQFASGSVTYMVCGRASDWCVHLNHLDDVVLKVSAAGAGGLGCQWPRTWHESGNTRSVLGMVGLASAVCDWVRWQVWPAIPVSVWQHMKLFLQFWPSGTLCTAARMLD